MTVEPIRPITIAVCQFAPRKKDTSGNIARIGRLCAQAITAEPCPQIIQFPETSLSGYFVEGGVRELACTAGAMANDIDESYRTACKERGVQAVTVDVIIGFYELWRDTLYNSAAYLTIGRNDGPPVIRHIHRKNYLPTYGLFDEERFVERGTSLRAFETPWGKAAMLICEDAWHSLSGTIAALDGAQVIFVLSAAPARGPEGREDGLPGPANTEKWERLIRDMAAEQGVFTSYANLVGTEGGKRFAGRSIIAGPSGDIRINGPFWQEQIVIATVDLNDIVRARASTPLLADLRFALPHVLEQLRTVTENKDSKLLYDGPDPVGADLLLEARGFHTGEFAVPVEFQKKLAVVQDIDPEGRNIDITQAVLREHGGPPPLSIDSATTEHWLIGFLREELAKRAYSRAIVGLSGGLDSAVVAALAAKAIGPENVTALCMPYRTSNPDSLLHAQMLVEQIGINSRTIDISATVDAYLANEPDADATRRGNIMSRTRMIAIFDNSAALKALPLGTGNKTERLFGYFTWHGDDAPPVNPIGDLYKTQVIQLARHLQIPDAIIDKPPSADLIRGQTDEGDLGISYAKADEILNWLLHGWSVDALVSRGFRPSDVNLVRDRVERTHWKRKGPSVALLSDTAIGESWLRPVDY